MKIIVLDIDDTLLTDKTKPSKYAKKIMGQIPAGIAVALVTSRSELELAETRASLAKAGIKYDKLFFHRKAKEKPAQTAREWKAGIARKLERTGFSVVVAIDNDAGARMAYGDADIETTAPQWFDYSKYNNKGRK